MIVNNKYEIEELVLQNKKKILDYGIKKIGLFGSFYKK